MRLDFGAKPLGARKRFRDRQKAAGSLVQAVQGRWNKGERRRFLACKEFRRRALAVDGNARRLVDEKQMLVLEMGARTRD